jgi:hypothetical protein
MRTLIDRGFDQIGIELAVIADIDSLSTMREAAQAGLADTILPMCALGPLRQTPSTHAIRRLTNPGIRRSLRLCRAEGMPLTSAVSAVADLLVGEILRLLPTGVWGDATLDLPQPAECPRQKQRSGRAGPCPFAGDVGAWPRMADLILHGGRCAACPRQAAAHTVSL